jgi:DNA modification methylase
VFEDGRAVLHQGDVMDALAGMADESVHCVVTSPPYWGLRDYGTETWEGGDPLHAHDRMLARGGRGGSGAPGKQTAGAFPSDLPVAVCSCGARRIDAQLGLEATPAEYVARMAEVFREVRRVLRKDGTLWLNMGDCYASGKGSCFNPGGGETSYKDYRKEAGVVPLNRLNLSEVRAFGLKPKDLVGMPWRLAFALQADGWWLRNDIHASYIVWAKPNPMPESVTDRCTRSHEYIFLLTKSARYFYDAEAIKERCHSGPSDVKKMIESLPRIGGKHKDLSDPFSNASAATSIGQKRAVGSPSGRNCRDVWTFATQSYPGAHFATFPEELPRRCIKAGTSERGCCPTCGAPWRRVVERTREIDGSAKGSRFDVGKTGARDGGDRTQAGERTLTRACGWRPGCSCGLAPVPCTVLDPFVGSGTTVAVALQLVRKGVGIELKPEYIDLAVDRIKRAVAPATARSDRAGEAGLFEEEAKP